MDTETISPENLEERIVWYSIRGTYFFYLIGALYVVAPVIAWVMLFIMLIRYYHEGGSHPGLPRGHIPLALWIWIIGMLVMEISLIMGHINFDLGVGKIIKSSVGWAKGWALLAIFPLLGCLNIRSKLIYRAANHVCLHTLLLLPLFVGAWVVGLPQTLWVSPLKAVGGPGPEFFALNLYEIDPGSGTPRWRLFTPWAPALGFVANIFFIFALQDESRKWKIIGIVASIFMVLMSQSRLALIAIVMVWLIVRVIAFIRHPATPFIVGAATGIIGLISITLYELVNQFWQAFRAARAGSSRVREALGRIAVDRWQNEAPIWGHGIVERGPHLVEFMPIGSHHSWYGLLFVKGIVGFCALLIPMAFGMLQLIWWSGEMAIVRVGLGMMMLLFMYTFGENLEILAYLVWPALMIIGMAHRDILIASHAKLSKQSPPPEGEPTCPK
ncbi:O-antigen ligase domain-containing protein [Desulfosediminicola flagellatus]|uniref:O-antigen ligase domain-containing protein n=1 Tax=Desulfosediminicola flagellatus TaxID=2569541 RepID=UPI0010ACA2CA|nr:O-antigen ligase domain-containing protein [Desulfosediminicola flagellatus]